jgi:hypothetical protein
VLDNYSPIEKEKTSEFEPTFVNTEISPELEPQIEIEPTTIFKTNMYEKFLTLEQKLISDRFLDENNNWIYAKKNKKEPSKQILATFLTGLLENNYFLPNKDSKIQDFFEDRYKINLGENFQPARRHQNEYSKRYKATFYNYPF